MNPAIDTASHQNYPEPPDHETRRQQYPELDNREIVGVLPAGSYKVGEAIPVRTPTVAEVMAAGYSREAAERIAANVAAGRLDGMDAPTPTFEEAAAAWNANKLNALNPSR